MDHDDEESKTQSSIKRKTKRFWDCKDPRQFPAAFRKSLRNEKMIKWQFLCCTLIIAVECSHLRNDNFYSSKVSTWLHKSLLSKIKSSYGTLSSSWSKTRVFCSLKIALSHKTWFFTDKEFFAQLTTTKKKESHFTFLHPPFLKGLPEMWT